MSLLERKPIAQPEKSCGLCRRWSPWLTHQFLGTCGAPDQLGRCTDRFDTCEKFEVRK